ncbi:hypothetical protein GmHk_18G052063 [Glycine max]|nr:hypothetical protein GmHk_18G052063 [Glycine max]
MATPPSSPPPPPPTVASTSPSTLKQTRKATQLRSLVTRPHGAERPMVHVDPATGKADDTHKKKLRTYLGIVARDKVDEKFEILEASNSRQKKKVLQTVGERWRQFKSDLTRKWALEGNKDGVDNTCEKMALARRNGPNFVRPAEIPCGRYDVRKKAQAIMKQNISPHVLSRGGYEYLEQKLMAEKTKKKLEKATKSGSTEGVINPLSPIRRHDVLTAAIGRPKHPGRVRVTGAVVTIKQYFGLTPRSSRCSSSIPLEELKQLTQQIKDQLEELIIEKVTRQLMASFSQMQSQLQSQMQSQGLALPPESEVGPSATRVSTKGSCVDPSPTDPETGDSDKCGLYIEKNLSRLVALGRVYEGSTMVHNIPLLHGHVKVGVEGVEDAEVPVPVPTDEAVVSPAKPLDRPDHKVDDPLYLMKLIIPQLFLKPLQRSGQSQFESESYIKSWMQSSKRDVYLGAYLNGPDNYLKGIINSALKGLNDTPQPKSKAGARWIVVKCNKDKKEAMSVAITSCTGCPR